MFVFATTTVADTIVPGLGTAGNVAYEIYKVADGDDKVCSRHFWKSDTGFNSSDTYYCYSGGTYITAYKHH